MIMEGAVPDLQLIKHFQAVLFVGILYLISSLPLNQFPFTNQTHLMHHTDFRALSMYKSWLAQDEKCIQEVKSNLIWKQTI